MDFTTSFECRYLFKIVIIFDHKSNLTVIFDCSFLLDSLYILGFIRKIVLFIVIFARYFLYINVFFLYFYIVYCNTVNSQKCFTWFYSVKEYCHNLSKSEIREMYVLGSSLIWTCWILNICFDFFHCICLHKITTNIWLSRSKIQNLTYPNQWAAKDIRIRFIGSDLVMNSSDVFTNLQFQIYKLF